MTNSATNEIPPSNIWAAADWLLARHEWPRELVARVVGPVRPGDEERHWLDELLDAYAALREWEAARKAYEREHPEPEYGTDGTAWEEWSDAGPSPRRGGVRDLAGMSGGEGRLLLLVATLHPSGSPEWSVAAVSFDERGVAFLIDWMKVCLRQVAYAPNAADALAALINEGSA